MAIKPLDNPLPDIYVDWSKNPQDPRGIGYSGKAVREGIQDKFREIDGRLDAIEEEIGKGSLDFRFQDMPSGSVVVNGAEPYPFPLHIRSMMVNPDGTEEEYDRNVALEISVTLNGNTVTTSLGNVAANKSITININPYVADGAAFTFKASNDTGASARSSFYDVIKANLSVSTRGNTWWASPFVSGGSWSVPLATNINISSTLKATLKDAGGVVRSSKTVLSTALSENFDLVMDHPNANGGASGIYTLRIELTSTDSRVTLSATPLEYKVCCVGASDTGTYLILNNIGTGLQNYQSNKIFDYAVRVGSGNPTVRFVSKVGTKTIYDSGAMSVVGGTVQAYNLSIQEERVDDSDFTVSVLSYVNTTLSSTNNFTVSNKNGFAATSGAKYLIRFNGRSNSELNRATFYNAIDNQAITPTITGVGWSGADGYYHETLSDGSVRSAFRILAGGRLVIPITPLSMRATEGRTIEFLYRLNNVRNFDSTVISCKAENGNGFTISANEAALYATSATQHDDQNCGTDYNEVLHIAFVVRPKPASAEATVDNFSCCEIYINGCRQRWFAYDRDLNINEPLTFGSDEADIDLFAVRVYEKVLTEAENEQNACNMLSTTAEKAAYKTRNAVRENGKVDFTRVRALCNVIVFECDELPSRTWSKEQSTEATIEYYWLGASTVEYYEVDNLAWQGTTSHNYGTNAEYGGLGQNYKWTADGRKMCAKANWASSMQSHKIGLTAAYTELAWACGVVPNTQRMSILQRPMVGFQRKSDGTMTYIGLFTVGADKGDKTTFGFTGNTLFMEGKDNEPLGTNFILPWNSDTASVNSDNDTWSLNGVKAWEDASKKPTYIANRWVPAYNFVYACMQRIKPAASTSAMTDQSYGYWLTSGDDIYHLYYYSAKQSAWVDSTVNLLASLVTGKSYGLTEADLVGKTDDEKNELFKAARRVKFKAEVETYFDKNCFLFHLCFIEFFGCTDNLSKNTYPFILDATSQTSKIMWRQDDLDSSFMTENQGKNYKKYCVEITDNYQSYGRNNLMVFNGTDNQFWLLVRLCFADEWAAYMREKFIPSLKYGQAADASTMFQQWCKRYLFDNAQNHFSEALYNECGRIRYGYGHLSSGYTYASIALSQDSGNCYYAEKQWLRMRHIYMSSKYCVGNFAAGSKTDTFTTRPYSAPDGVGNTFEITPAIWMYPSVQNGESVVRGERIWQGGALRTWSVTLPATQGDQEQRINGMSYIKSLGSMYNAAIRGNVDVNGRMLVELKMGSRDDVANIRSQITGLGIGDATSLQNLVLANVSTLQGVVDLSDCVNLQTLYAEGTSVTSVPLCDGGPLKTIYLPGTLTSLALNSKKDVEQMVIGGFSNLTSVEFSRCNDYVVNQILGALDDIL